MLNKRKMEMRSLNVGPRRPLVTPGRVACPVVWEEARKPESEDGLREGQENGAELN